MDNIKRRLPVTMIVIIGLIILSLIFASCNEERDDKQISKPISKTEIIAFQNSYEESFNAIVTTIENDGYFESEARKHIDEHYNFDQGEVMFKIGNDHAAPFRYSYSGVLSYLIGKNANFPNDEGIATQNWRKIEWDNYGIINEGDVSIVMGRTTLKGDNNRELIQNFTMCLKRNESGTLKLITYKISNPCD